MFAAGQEEVQNLVRELPRRLETYREILLANLVMIAETPAPTFEETCRGDFLKIIWKAFRISLFNISFGIVPELNHIMIKF